MDHIERLYDGACLAVGACIGMVAFEYSRRVLKIALLTMTAALSGARGWFNGKGERVVSNSKVRK